MSELEVGWLIERYDADSRPLWWCGLSGLGSLWSHDANDAVRFSREVDARRVASTLPAPSGTATEHMWCP